MHVFTFGLSGYVYGGFPTLCHNEFRDFTAAALFEVCYNVAIEPLLQPLPGEPTNMEYEEHFILVVYIRSNTLIDHENKLVSVS